VVTWYYDFVKNHSLLSRLRQQLAPKCWQISTTILSVIRHIYNKLKNDHMRLQ